MFAKLMAFLHCFLTHPHLWSIKEPGIQTLIRRLFWGTAAKSLQSCPILCDPIDGSPPGSAILGILQARTPEWVAISFSNAWKWKVRVKSLSHVRLLVTPWAAAHQAPPSMGFSRQVVVNRKSLLSSFKEVSFKIFLRACSTPQSWMLEIIWDVLRKLPREKYGSIFTSGAPNPYLPLIYFLVPSPIPLF